MDKQVKPASFAFKLAEKQKQTPQATEATVWTVREGVSALGCTGTRNARSIFTPDNLTLCF